MGAFTIMALAPLPIQLASVRLTPCLAVQAFTQLVLPTPTGHPRVPTAQLPITGDKGLYFSLDLVSLPHCFEREVLNHIVQHLNLSLAVNCNGILKWCSGNFQKRLCVRN